MVDEDNKEQVAQPLAEDAMSEAFAVQAGAEDDALVMIASAAQPEIEVEPRDAEVEPGLDVLVPPQSSDAVEHAVYDGAEQEDASEAVAVSGQENASAAVAVSEQEDASEAVAVSGQENASEAVAVSGQENASEAVAVSGQESASEADKKKPSTSSGIALPSFVERNETGVFGAVGTATGIPLPSRDEPSDKDAAAIPAADEPPPRQQHTVISKHEDAQVVEGVEAEHAQVEAPFSDEDDLHTQAGIEEARQEALSAAQLGVAFTANGLLSFEPLASLTQYPHLYTALLNVKGVWQNSVSMDELIVAAARAEQSDQHSDAIKTWYATRIKKLVINALDFVWIAQAYNVGKDGLMVIDDEQLFTALTGTTASDFRELCSRGFINRSDFSALVQQIKLWETEALSPADYIFSHLRREQMVA